MNAYAGNIKLDPPYNGGTWVKETGYGSEIYNFKPYRGKVFGYVANAPHFTINIDKLGAQPTDKHICGVRVFWTATRPNGGRRVVGWYNRATVFRQATTRPSGFSVKGTLYIITANASDAYLIPADQRLIHVPDARKKGIDWGMGQSNLRFCDSKARHFVNSLLKHSETNVSHISEDNPTSRAKENGTGWNADSFERRKIELAAMKAVAEYFGRHWKLEDVSHQQGLGYDFRATRRGEPDLHLEVKGCKGSAPAFELTPSEFRHVEKLDRNYRVCVLTSALESSPRLRIFQYHPGTQFWQDGEGHALTVRESTGARCSAE